MAAGSRVAVTEARNAWLKWSVEPKKESRTDNINKNNNKDGLANGVGGVDGM